jgi:hypothetical protein
MIRLFIAVVVCILPVVTFAQSEFSIRVFGAVDTEKPSTPLLVAVTPITINQIDVSWSTSTDNFLVFGYVVFRDGVVIATTTIPSYNDTGLSASTTYSYEVQAFDTVPNYSTSSVAAATTTPDIPPEVVTATSTSQTGTVTGVVLNTISVTPDVITAVVDLSVRRPARIEVRIGETDSYEVGYFVGNAYKRTHTVPLSDLRPGTRYFYEVIGYTPGGRQTVLKKGSFVTLSDLSPLLPLNVQGFTAVTAGVDVSLSWQIPSGFPANARVRVVRSHLGFPAAINDGVVVYEGVSTQTKDVAVFGQQGIAYYTAFVIDPDGSVSSGTIVLARASVASVPFGDLGSTTVGVPEGEHIDFTPVPADPSMPAVDVIEVWQNDAVYSFASTSITLQDNVLFSVSIPATAIKGSFKTIVASLTDPRDSSRSFSFLLRLNADRTMYAATIAPVYVAGVSELVVEIYDYDARVIGNYHTTIVFVAGEEVGTTTLQLMFFKLETFFWGALLVVPFIVLLILWIIFRRRHEDNNTV